MVRQKQVARKRPTGSQGSSGFTTKFGPVKNRIAAKQAPTLVLKTKKRKSRHNLVLREIRRLQNSTNLLVPRAAFLRVVRRVTATIKSEMKYKVEAIFALQEATEAFIVQLLEDANLLAHHSRRVTLMKRDIMLAKRIRGLSKFGEY
ncbi:unnamed protein product [Bursaphelenchus okinawaensis]|uniref:Core Histone H2A/H2B/H3 domain-containing protein n=1 Tax=Bursaphelenchus okinawaensis TaxID=465554 RepID=A0A811JRH9_9BILA|nr:unnamed protein product [Bursaphelenchus okinawaensis]CAG9079525.1 unnamed protein product [Bursaphelenchus okinawaensis]